jgi:four helix bundle protein
MLFSHEKLDVYRVAIEYVRWSFSIARRVAGMHRHAKDQLLRAAQSIPLNIAEGNGKATENDRRHFFEIARGSALECAAIQDVLEVCGALAPDENHKGKDLLDRIVAMLTKMGGRGYVVKEEMSNYDSRSESGSELVSAVAI